MSDTSKIFTAGFQFNEKYLSQIPALQLLVNLGFTYLTPEQALSQRGGKQGNVLLEDILRERLKKITASNTGGSPTCSRKRISRPPFSG